MVTAWPSCLPTSAIVLTGDIDFGSPPNPESPEKSKRAHFRELRVPTSSLPAHHGRANERPRARRCALPHSANLLLNSAELDRGKQISHRDSSAAGYVGSRFSSRPRSNPTFLFRAASSLLSILLRVAHRRLECLENQANLEPLVAGCCKPIPQSLQSVRSSAALPRHPVPQGNCRRHRQAEPAILSIANPPCSSRGIDASAVTNSPLVFGTLHSHPNWGSFSLPLQSQAAGAVFAARCATSLPSLPS